MWAIWMTDLEQRWTWAKRGHCRCISGRGAVSSRLGNAQLCCCGMSWAGSSVGWHSGHCLLSVRGHCWNCLELPGSSSALLCLGCCGCPGTCSVWPWGRHRSGVGVEACCVLVSDSPSDPQEPQQWVCSAFFSSATPEHSKMCGCDVLLVYFLWM